MSSSSARSVGSVCKIRLNCSVCESALVDGLFQCSNALSLKSQCRVLLCSNCAEKHTMRFGHPTPRTLAFDPIIADGIFYCPVDGCDQELSASQYNEHVIMCSHGELSCPLCSQPLALNSLCAHLVSGHEFNDVQLSYGHIIESEISKYEGCIFRSTEEAFIFFILDKTLYLIWIGSLSNPPDFKLMMAVANIETGENFGVVRQGAVPRRSDLFQVMSFKRVPANVFKISIMID
ncbi:hypothetical protein GQ55_7G014500 [Panicum hallii var. hallii]|jgi:hypothetical protein|uniref:SIAH-type domain-containing protein n=1 Tax=Panicum hallii var. hallii TaxID=1504633 RepID=A0A2T7CRR0_9POAL|nr:hypothetical protein GQ55_7G014500 [Panicum hallii var. hallii]